MTETAGKPQEFYLSSMLLDVFEEVGAIPKRYNSLEILKLLKSYLDLKPNLIDPQNRLLVNCENDNLGKALGVKKFEFKDIRQILIRNIVPVEAVIPYKPKISVATSVSNPCTYDETQNEENSSLGYENVNGIHEDSTSDNQEINGSGLTSYEDSSDSESFICGIVGFEDDFFADESDTFTDYSSDNSLDEEDQWSCLTCGISNRPFMRYCEKCWKERKEWLPDRPTTKKRRKPRPKKEKIRPKFEHQSANNEKHSEAHVIDVLSQDSGIMSQDPKDDLNISSQESTFAESSSQGLDHVASLSESSSIKEKKRRNHSPLPEEPPHKIQAMYSPIALHDISRKFCNFMSTREGKKWIQSKDGQEVTKALENVPDKETEKFARKVRKFMTRFSGRRWMQSQEGSELLNKLEEYSSTSEVEDASTKSLCKICCAREANTGLIHTNVSHMGYCYPCAKRLFNTKSRCPACRRRIERISKCFYI